MRIRPGLGLWAAPARAPSGKCDAREPPRQDARRAARSTWRVGRDVSRRHGPVSKSELAGRSGVGAWAVLQVASPVSRRGVVRMVGAGPSRGGRPPVLLELSPDAHCAVGVAIRIAG